MSDTGFFWGSVNLALIPSETTSALSEIQSVTSTIATILNGAAAVGEIVVAAITPTIDATKAVVEALHTIIDGLLDFLVTTQVGVLWYVPESFKNALSPLEILDLVGNSFFDEQDSDRPLPTDGSKWAVASFWMGGFNLAETLALWDKVAKLFGMPASGKPRSQPYKDGEYPPPASVGEGQAPNWKSLRLADLGFMKELTNLLLSARDKISYVKDQVAFIGSLIDQIKQRAATLSALSDEIEALLDAFAAAQALGSGVHLLAMTGEGSAEAQAADWRSAANHPDYPFRESEYAASAAVLVFHIQSESGSKLSAFKTLFGIPDRLGSIGKQATTKIDQIAKKRLAPATRRDAEKA